MARLAPLQRWFGAWLQGTEDRRRPDDHCRRYLHGDHEERVLPLRRVHLSVHGIRWAIFSYLLYVSGRIPRFLAQLGLVGYTGLAIGIPVTLMTTVQLDEGWGLIFVAAGAVFEFVVPLLLIIKGFSIRREEPRLGGDHLSDSVEPVAVPA